MTMPKLPIVILAIAALIFMFAPNLSWVTLQGPVR